MFRKKRNSVLVLLIAVTAIIAGCGNKPDRPNTAAKPLATPQVVANRPKIIAFGDSLTAGFGLSEKESYPYLLQEKLKADGYEYEVINAGVSGDTTLGGLERADWVFEQDNAKIVILELGANDLLRGIPVAQMKKNLDQIIRKAKAKNLRILLCGMLAPPSMGSDYQQQFTVAFPDLATEHKVEFLPFLLENVALKKELNQADGIHPNAEGEKIMTENVYRALKPMLAK
ncbi:MAG TPA: arylesterase [Pyrinomonadaceae bacterium]|nr:arylesterase [Pyrinomonadaceae bacterium]